MDHHFEDQHYEELQFEEEELEGSTQRIRGPSIPNWKEQPCSFDSSRKCIHDNSSVFSKHVVAEVRDYRNIPMVAYWNKEKTKEIAAKNKHNRQLKTMNHTVGSKSFARVQE
ncbi:uncharacterized protein LOC125480743 [Pyrus x bretschneideri]|uniref:uncharacterized protein LOC125480743 n=1 Tax=Pyrus x bretschneideri TaxID=225117 RepID=UPI00202DFF7F|nr:uncharacterized protein LOC125480743 [Pyrus x bretschneideri]